MRTIPLLFAALVAVFGCNRSHTAAPPVAPAVRVQAVERPNGHGMARYSASIAPAARVDLAFKVSGYVDSIARARGSDGRVHLLQDGDRVTRGMEMASIRKIDYAQKLDEARASLAEANASRQQAEVDAQRAVKLLASRSISQAEADAAIAKRDGAIARAAQAQVRLDQARTALSDTMLRPAFDGIVVERRIEVGTLASAGTVAFAIADIDNVKAIFAVPDRVVGTLRLGARQELTLEAFRGKTFKGQITRISQTADTKSRAFEVEVTLPNTGHELKPGMVAALDLAASAQSAPDALLPLTAVVRSPAKSAAFAVFVVADESGQTTARLRPVELGDFLGNRIAIRSGLGADDRVVVMGAPLLTDGQPVQIIR
jgi:RND family efflux transporter MFP subunit